jgi:uncharacterized protein
MRVRVAYALAQREWIFDLDLEVGATAAEAIERSGVLQACPELRVGALDIGIFSRRCSVTAVLHEGDRVEIYRPLQVDPKEARRARAAARRKV